MGDGGEGLGFLGNMSCLCMVLPLLNKKRAKWGKSSKKLVHVRFGSWGAISHPLQDKGGGKKGWSH